MIAEQCLAHAMVRLLMVAVLVMLAGVTTAQWSLWTEWSDCPACSAVLGEGGTRERY